MIQPNCFAAQSFFVMSEVGSKVRDLRGPDSENVGDRQDHARYSALWYEATILISSMLL